MSKSLALNTPNGLAYVRPEHVAAVLPASELIGGDGRPAAYLCLSSRDTLLVEGTPAAISATVDEALTLASGSTSDEAPTASATFGQSVHQFVEAQLIRKAGQSLEIGEAYTRYASWCEAAGLEVRQPRTFVTILRAHGIRYVPGRVRHFAGVRLRTLADASFALTPPAATSIEHAPV